MSTPNKKEEIINASIEIFVEEGYDRPSMDAIAKNANVSKRTLYKHFPNKKALLEDLIVHLIEQSITQTYVKFDADTSFEVQVSQFIKNKLEQIFDPSGIKLARIIMSEAFKQSDFLKERIENILRLESSSMEWVKEAQAHGEIPKDLDSFEVLHYLNKLIRGVFFYPMLLETDFKYSEKDIKDLAKTFIFWCQCKAQID